MLEVSEVTGALELLWKRWQARIGPQPLQSLLHWCFQEPKLPKSVTVLITQEGFACGLPGELRPAASATLLFLMPIDRRRLLRIGGLELFSR